MSPRPKIGSTASFPRIIAAPWKNISRSWPQSRRAEKNRNRGNAPQMISIAPSVLALAAALGGAAEPPPAGLQFELTTLSGRRQAGLLTDLTSDSVSLSVSGKTTTVPLGEVLDLRAVSSKSAQATVDLRRP